VKSNARMQLAAIVWARTRVWAFQMRHIIKGQIVWQEEIFKEQLTPRGRMVITYIGVCKIPEGAKWPHDPSITRRAFYNRPPVRICHVVDEHATQHL
jgi:hypothetical protein